MFSSRKKENENERKKSNLMNSRNHKLTLILFDVRSPIMSWRMKNVFWRIIRGECKWAINCAFLPCISFLWIIRRFNVMGWLGLIGLIGDLRGWKWVKKLLEWFLRKLCVISFQLCQALHHWRRLFFKLWITENIQKFVSLEQFSSSIIIKLFEALNEFLKKLLYSNKFAKNIKVQKWAQRF